MYKVVFEDRHYNKLEFVCKDAVELGGLISNMYRHTTDDELTFIGRQFVPMEDDLGETLEEVK